MAIEKETALYEPIKRFLVRQGFEVKAEVKGCDITAMRGDELVIVELKTRMNLTVVLQGLERQKLTDFVYIAIEAPKKRKNTGHDWREIQGLCQKLGLGLMTVNFQYKYPRVEVVVEPGPYTPRKSPQKRYYLVREFNKRSGDYNIGGSTRRPIVTGYREEALRLAKYIAIHEKASPREMREALDCPKAASILQKDFYGWFHRVQRGIYQLTPKGQAALEQYSDVVVSLEEVLVQEIVAAQVDTIEQESAEQVKITATNPKIKTTKKRKSKA